MSNLIGLFSRNYGPHKALKSRYLVFLRQNMAEIRMRQKFCVLALPLLLSLRYFYRLIFHYSNSFYFHSIMDNSFIFIISFCRDAICTWFKIQQVQRVCGEKPPSYFCPEAIQESSQESINVISFCVCLQRYTISQNTSR